ncbi:EboA domain-containing protein [Kitasatospora sp. NPDC005856]|uniref:EboA domain-containing protein n=1 Tax=Kitasatospora sp. NPDC005856 TaxID=3154566 RepID=UPI0033EEC3C2
MMRNHEDRSWPATNVPRGSTVVVLRTAKLGWLAGAERRVRARPTAVREEFALAGQAVGTEPLRPALDPEGLVFGTADDRARARLLTVLAEVLPAGLLENEIERLYRYGDDAQRRGVLRALELLPVSVVRLGLELVADGLSSDDPQLIAAAMGPFAAEHLDQEQWRQGVMACLLAGVTLSAVSRLVPRTDGELLRMADALARELRATGGEIGPDLRTLLGMTVVLALVPPRSPDGRR